MKQLLLKPYGLLFVLMALLMSSCLVINGVSPLSGPVGQVVTVTGARSSPTGPLNDALASIRVGTTLVPWTVINDATIQFIIPPGTGQVVINFNEAYQDGSTVDYTYTPPPAGQEPVVTSISPTTGASAGGTTLTLNGSHLEYIAQVQIGGKNAPILSQTTDTVTVTLPNGSGPTEIMMNISGYPLNDFVSTGQTYTYDIATSPSPNITSITPLSGPAAGGTPVSIQGTHLDLVAHVQFAGHEAPITAATRTATSLEVTSPAGSGNATIAISDTTTPASFISTGYSFTYATSPPVNPTVSSIFPTSGSTLGGTQVTLGGTNLDQIARIQVGGHEATIQSQTATALVVITPAGTGVAPVTVSGISAPSTFVSTGYSFSYITIFPPVVTAVAPVYGPSAGGNTITVTGENFINVTQVHFGTTAASTWTVQSPTSLTVQVPRGVPGTVPVSVTTPEGESSTTSSTYYTYQGAPRLYVTASQTLYEINVTDKTVLPIVTVSQEHCDIAVTPDGRTAFLTNTLLPGVEVIDLNTRSISTLVTLGFGADKLAVDPTGSFTAFSLPSQDRVSRVLNKSLTIESPPIRVADQPLSIAISEDGIWGYVTHPHLSQITFIDFRTQKVVHSEKITANMLTGDLKLPSFCYSIKKPRTRCCVEPYNKKLGRQYSSIRPTPAMIQVHGNKLYITDATYPLLYVVNAKTRKLETAIKSLPSRLLSISPQGRYAYSIAATGMMTIIDLKSKKEIMRRRLPTGSNPVAMCLSSDGQTLYVLNQGNGKTLLPHVLFVATKTLKPGQQIALPANVEPANICAAPDAAPIAAFTVTVGAVNTPSQFDATKSIAPVGTLRYVWDFGDTTKAVTTTSSLVSHTYKKKGVYTVTLRVITSGGTSVQRTFTGQMVSNNGSQSAKTTTTITVP